MAVLMSSSLLAFTFAEIESQRTLEVLGSLWGGEDRSRFVNVLDLDKPFWMIARCPSNLNPQVSCFWPRGQPSLGSGSMFQTFQLWQVISQTDMAQMIANGSLDVLISFGIYFC